MNNNPELNTDIVLEFSGVTKIESIKTRTSEKNINTVSGNKLQLSLNTIYRLPISNKNLSLTKSNCLSPIGSINEKIQILNVENGLVTVTPIVHGVFLINGDILGKLI